MSEPVLISGALIGSCRLIAEFGVDPLALAVEARLPERVFEEPDVFVPAGRIVDFLELAARACRCESFALRHALELPLGMRGLGIRGQGWMLMRSAKTLREALADFANLYGLYTDAGKVHLQPHRADLWLSYVFLPVGRFGETQVVHLTLARLCLFIGESLHRSWRPQAVELRHEPADRKPFFEFFGPRASFGAERDAILIGHDDLNRSLNPSDGAQAYRNNLYPRDLDGPALLSEVKALLPTLLRHEHASIDRLCGALGLSRRTVQRRLLKAGTSYRELVDGARADLAWRQVKGTDLSFGRIAELLGYESQAAFTRAFRRWYDLSPSAARRV